MPTVRRARLEDVEAIGVVHHESIQRLCADHYTAAEIAAWAAPRRPEHYEQSIRGKEFYVAKEAGAIVGFGVLEPASSEVEAVSVSPMMARRGVGFSLLRTLEGRARARGLPALHLCAALNAVPFYERAGYEQQGLTRHRLQNGVEIACVLMTKALAGDAEG